MNVKNSRITQTDFVLSGFIHCLQTTSSFCPLYNMLMSFSSSKKPEFTFWLLGLVLKAVTTHFPSVRVQLHVQTLLFTLY